MLKCYEAMLEEGYVVTPSEGDMRVRHVHAQTAKPSLGKDEWTQHDLLLSQAPSKLEKEMANAQKSVVGIKEGESAL